MYVFIILDQLKQLLLLPFKNIKAINYIKSGIWGVNML
jgi:hypothetical protein